MVGYGPARKYFLSNLALNFQVQPVLTMSLVEPQPTVSITVAEYGQAMAKTTASITLRSEQ
jgi:hypothetical protein